MTKQELMDALERVHDDGSEVIIELLPHTDYGDVRQLGVDELSVVVSSRGDYLRIKAFDKKAVAERMRDEAVRRIGAAARDRWTREMGEDADKASVAEVVAANLARKCPDDLDSFDADTMCESMWSDIEDGVWAMMSDNKAGDGKGA